VKVKVEKTSCGTVAESRLQLLLLRSVRLWVRAF